MLLTIITINYNNKSGLQKTMQSVFEQTYNDIEYIIIDGKSTDGSKEYIEKNTSKISYWVSELDKGIYNAMNKGIDNATGDYLLFLNSGDCLVQNDIIEKVNAKLTDGLDIYYGNLNFVSNNSIKLMEYPKKPKFSFFYNGGYIPHPSSFIKKRLFEEVVGYYDEDYIIIGDWDFFIKAICKYNASYKYVDLTVTNFDINGLSSDASMNSVKIKEKQKCLSSHFPMFIEDGEEFFKLKKKLNVKKFKQLYLLESNKFAKKLNTVWLFLMCLVFNKKIK
jgi:glycosyltransferase involved in cell wall biosynthesis